jgi:hypothetical protein
MQTALRDDDDVMVARSDDAPRGGLARDACSGEAPDHGDDRLIELVRLVFLRPSRSGELVRSAAFVGIANDHCGTIAAEVAQWLASHLKRAVCVVHARSASPDRLRELMQTFDFVLIDAPDLTRRRATALCASADRVVLVADARTTTRAAARTATERLRASGARVCGGVLIE